MQSIVDILRAALAEATKAEAQKHALAKCLYNELHDAADELRVALAALTYKADVAVVVMRSNTVFAGVRTVEVGDMLSGSDFYLRAGRDDLIALRWRPGHDGPKMARDQADKAAGEAAATVAYKAAMKGGASHEDATAASRKAWGEAAYASDAAEAAKGWACAGLTERHATAVDALRAGLKHPETLRAMVEVLRSLPVGHP